MSNKNHKPLTIRDLIIGIEQGFKEIPDLPAWSLGAALLIVVVLIILTRR